MTVIIDGTTGIAGPATGLTGTAPSLTAGGATTSATVTDATQAAITSAANLATVGTVTTGTWSGAFGAVSGANLTTLNASNLASGTVATARLGTGTANTTTYLRGDQTWATVAGGVTSVNGNTGAVTVTEATTTNVLNATASASVGAVGTYASLYNGNNANAAGVTRPGSNMQYGGVIGQCGTWSGQGVGTSPSGTWRSMGGVSVIPNIVTWLRIS